MSTSYYQNRVNQLDREIAELEKKIASESQIEADRNSRIITVQRSITKNTSASIVNMRMRQIENYNKEIASAQKKRADLQKKLADKRADRAKYGIELQKEIERENQKAQLAQQRLQEQYAREVEELTAALQRTVSSQSPQHNLYNEVEDAEFDVFISHASEDKESFVEYLVQALKDKGIKVWYDSLNIEWGDSLRTQIDNGLKRSTFGIVVLSERYIEKGWTQYELEGLFNIEMTEGKTILPIWHNITKQQVMQFSPTLAGRKALSSAIMTPDEIADEFVKLLKNNSK